MEELLSTLSVRRVAPVEWGELENAPKIKLLPGERHQLTAQADANIQQQAVFRRLSLAELEQRREAILQPIQNFNQQQVALRWNQYEQKMKDLEAKSRELHVCLGATYPCRPPPAL